MAFDGAVLKVRTPFHATLAQMGGRFGGGGAGIEARTLTENKADLSEPRGRPRGAAASRPTRDSTQHAAQQRR